MIDNNLNKVYFLYRKEENVFETEQANGYRLLITEGFDNVTNDFKQYVTLDELSSVNRETVNTIRKELTFDEFNDLLFIIESHTDIVFANSFVEDDEDDFDICAHGYNEELYFDCAMYNRLISGPNIINDAILADDFNTDNYTNYEYKGLLAINKCVKAILEYLDRIGIKINL